MLRLETQWQSDELVMWGVETETNVPLATEALQVALQELCAGKRIPCVCDDAGRLRFAPAAAVDLLRSMPAEETVYSQATQAWRWMADFVIDRIIAGQFYGTAETEAGMPVGVWRLLVTRSEELQWLQVVADLLYPGNGTDGQGGLGDECIESFLNATADAVIRRSFDCDSFFAETATRCRAGIATVDMRFLGSLLTPDRSIEHVDREVLDQIRLWIDALHDSPVSAAFRLVFCLQEPLGEDEEDWRVQLLMEVLNSDTEPTPVSRLWEMGQKLPPILGRNLTRQRQCVLDQLQRAAEVWPTLQGKITPEPSELSLSPAEAVALARQWAARLVDAGFGLQLPDWCYEPARELSIQLAVRPVEPDDSLFFPPTEGPRHEGQNAGDLITSANQQVGLNSLLQFDWRVAVGTMQLSEQQFESILRLQRPLVRFNGQWVEVDADAARRAMEFIDHNRTGKMTLAEALRTAHATSKSESGLNISGLSGADWIGQLLSQMPDSRLQALPQPPTFAGQLRPYQLRGLQWLAYLQRMGIGACLADDMGLGKTIQFISLLLLERQQAQEAGQAKPGPTLLFAPTSVLGNWAYEMERFAPSLKLLIHHGVLRQHGEAFRAAAVQCDMVITTYALASRDAEDFANVAWHRLALDEAQKIKNPSAASTQAIRNLPASYRVALTGTPIENHLSELWSIMEILNPGLLGSAGMFREQFSTPIERGGDKNRAMHLRELIKPFVLRRTKSDPAIAGDLPEKLEMKVFCNLTVEQAALYQRITDEMLGQIDAASGIRRRGLILAALTRLKQVCDHPLLLNGKVAGIQQVSDEVDSRSGKCERLIEMLEEVVEEGDSALVFTQFKEMGDILERLLARRLNVSVLYLHGGTPAIRRDAMIRQFQDPAGKVPIFLLSLRAGGLGLNLTKANHVFHFDRWWNPAVEQQATDRAHRIGQSRKVQVHKYVCIGTMEERIDRMLTDKMQLADRIITSGDEWLTSLSTDELRKTLQLSGNAVEDYGPGSGNGD